MLTLVSPQLIPRIKISYHFLASFSTGDDLSNKGIDEPCTAHSGAMVFINGTEHSLCFEAFFVCELKHLLLKGCFLEQVFFIHLFTKESHEFKCLKRLLKLSI